MENTLNSGNIITLKTKNPYREKYRDLDFRHYVFLNDSVYYLQELLSSRSKYSKKDLESDRFWNDNKPNEFALFDSVSKEVWICRFMGIESKNVKFGMTNETKKESEYFQFPYRNLKSRLHREKMATWIIAETFSPLFGEEEVESFMKTECIYSSAFNFIIYS